MKKLAVFSTAVIALSLSSDIMAQTRGPHYNPGGGSPSSSSSSSPRGPSYNPGGSSSSSSSSSRPSPSSSSSSSSSYRPSPSPSSSSSSTPRGPSYNPSPSRPSTPSYTPSPSVPSRPSPSPSSSSTPRGPSYNPSPSAPSRPAPSTPTYTPSPSTSTTPRGPSYNPTPSTPSRPTPSTPTYTPSPSTSTTPRGPSYNPTPSTPSTPTPSTSTTPRGPRYNPSPDPTPSTSTTPRGPRYNPSPDPTPSTPGPVVVTPTRPSPRPIPNPGTVHVPRGPRYNPPGPSMPAPHREGHVIVTRTVFTHAPHVVNRTIIVYPTPRDYYMHVNRHYIYRRWIQEPVIWTYTDGYWDIDDYPYYVDNGYRYRYSPVETCSYDLVDGNDYTVVNQFQGACNSAYDRCATQMDSMNTTISSDRYFCAESVDDDLVVDDTTEYNPLPVDITAQRQAAIEAFLQGKTYEDLYKAGREGVGKCKIEKKGLFAKCKYMVKVDGKAFPDPTGFVCSSPEKAALVGCKETTQKGNAGCILEKAVLQGFCQD